MTEIRNFWVLSRNGIPLFFHGKKDASSQIVISGFFAAIQILIESLEQSQLNKIELKNNTYFYYLTGPIISVIEADPKNEIENQVYQIIAQRLGRAFLAMFSQETIVKNENNSSKFCYFLSEYEKITAEVETMLQQSHREFLSEYFVQAAKDENVLGAVVYDLERDEILSIDLPPDCDLEDFESFGSMLFAFLGRLGKTLNTGAPNEVLIRCQKYWIGGFKKGPLAVFMLFDLEYFGKVLPEFVNAPLKEL